MWLKTLNPMFRSHWCDRTLQGPAKTDHTGDLHLHHRQKERETGNALKIDDMGEKTSKI